MKQNGFTLVEVLAVIIILGIIGVIVMPAVTGSINDSKDDLYDMQVSNIIEASKTWAADNLSSLPTTVGEEKKVSLKELQENGYIDENITNPKTNKVFDPTTNCVNISFNGKKYTYSLGSC